MAQVVNVGMLEYMEKVLPSTQVTIRRGDRSTFHFVSSFFASL